MGGKLRGSGGDEVLACDGELVEDGDVAEEFFHAVGDGVVDAGDEIAGVSRCGVGGSVGGYGRLGEEGAEVAAAADGGNEEEFLVECELGGRGEGE